MMKSRLAFLYESNQLSNSCGIFETDGVKVFDFDLAIEVLHCVEDSAVITSSLNSLVTGSSVSLQAYFLKIHLTPIASSAS